MEAIEITTSYELTRLTVIDDNVSVPGILFELNDIGAVLMTVCDGGDPQHMRVRCELDERK